MTAPQPSRAAGTRPAPRRRAARAARRPRGTSVLSLAAVLATAVMLVGVERVGPEPVAPGRAEPAAVDSVTQVCLPDPFGRSRTEASVLTVAPLVSDRETGPRGRIWLTGPAEDADAGARVDPDRGSLMELPAGREVKVVRSEGGAAPGRTTFLVGDGAPAGGTVQECLPPRAEWWFTGAGAGLDHRSRLVLANVDTGPATVDVRVYGVDGRVDGIGMRGISLAAGETRTVDLVDVAPQADELSVHVATTRGRVGAAVADSFTGASGVDPGRAWLPAQERATRRLRLGPLPVRAATRTLILANPTEREALVELSVSGASGAFVPTAGAQVRVPAGSVATADVAAAIPAEAASLQLRSNVPVTASLRSTVRQAGAERLAYAATLPPVAGAAAALALPGGTLHLTAGDTAVDADVMAYARDGSKLTSSRVEVPVGATVSRPLPRRAAYVVVDPTRGRPVAGVVAGVGDGYSGTPLRPLLLELRRPSVVPIVPPRVGQPGSAP